MQVTRSTTQLEATIGRRISDAITLLQLDIVLQCVSSGFGLELYAKDEMTSAYWVCGMVLKRLLDAPSAIASQCASISRAPT
jgi:hypothetical protein